MSAEEFLKMFEEAVAVQAELVGRSKAYDQARRAGLTISRDGHISTCTGHPAIVLLRLIRTFTENNNMKALEKCTPLIARMEEICPLLEEQEKQTTV